MTPKHHPYLGQHQQKPFEKIDTYNHSYIKLKNQIFPGGLVLFVRHQLFMCKIDAYIIESFPVDSTWIFFIKI